MTEQIPGIDQRALLCMQADGLGWLADIVDRMFYGDPYAEGACAQEICEAFRQNRPAA